MNEGFTPNESQKLARSLSVGASSTRSAQSWYEPGDQKRQLRQDRRSLPQDSQARLRPTGFSAVMAFPHFQHMGVIITL